MPLPYMYETFPELLQSVGSVSDEVLEATRAKRWHERAERILDDVMAWSQSVKEWKKVKAEMEADPTLYHCYDIDFEKKQAIKLETIKHYDPTAIIQPIDKIPGGRVNLLLGHFDISLQKLFETKIQPPPIVRGSGGRVRQATARIPDEVFGHKNLPLMCIYLFFSPTKARAGVEMAVIDAVANTIRIPLWRLFGGASNTVTTAMTIPIVAPNEAAQLAAKYQGQGFQTLKLKVGKNLNSDIEVLKTIRLVHPDCSFILDANGGYTANQAIEVLDRLNEMGVTPVLFEQPVHRDDWEGLREVSIAAMEKYRVAVAADESCRGLHDAQKIIHGNLAHVINTKLAKLGGSWSPRSNRCCKKSCFIDLDTPLLLSEDPVYGGYEASGPVYKFKNARGHGGFLHLDNNNGWVYM
ncbi:L-Ala-D/L-Glu epimerase [Triticum urartu]|uniref:L-Ala-D/L-Glu epimerase n=1 Tax=Triticum urartu TaxID=4572 RepID=M7ZIY0_TRIUA|nr:L-Ala-D/L-Glu epimerase [Triticum urartu]